MGIIYHIATEADWEQARRDGQYTTSTRGVTLAEQGFIHASAAEQVAGVANAFYKGKTDLLVLVIDTGKVSPEIRYEQVPGHDAPFPHIYGPLSTDAVVGTRPLVPGADGGFTFSALFSPLLPCFFPADNLFCRRGGVAFGAAPGCARFLSCPCLVLLRTLLAVIRDQARIRACR
jgi:uncharacterized protein (DUF952 family)